MRSGNLAGRLTVFVETGAIDVETASGGRFGSDPSAVYVRWDEFTAWASGLSQDAGTDFSPDDLGPPSPAPRQVLAIGLNYADHVAEVGVAVPETPAVFTKFVSSFAGPDGDVVLPRGSVDWEVELVTVISRQAHQVSASDAWGYVAGLTVGQDFSEREVQGEGPVPQFSLGKSFPGFAPMGPWLVTPDEFSDPDDIAVGCEVNGEAMQHGRTSDLVFGVPELVQRLSSILTLYPGDVLFTGTPSGVGASRRPPRFLAVGDVVVSHIEGIGSMRHRFVAG